MARDARRQQLARLLAPRLAPDEEIVGNGAAWFASITGTRRLFVGRHYRLVALTDQRLLVFPRRARRRRDAPLLDAPIAALRLERGGGVRVLFPVIVETGDGHTAVLEFRPSQRALGRAIVAALRQPVPPVPPPAG